MFITGRDYGLVSVAAEMGALQRTRRLALLACALGLAYGLMKVALAAR